MNIIRFAFSAAIVLAIGAVAAACDGGGSLSAEEYFAKLKSISDEAAEKESALQPSEEEAANFTGETEKNFAIEFLDSAAAIMEDAFAQIEDLNPPDDIKDAHDEFVRTGKERAETFREFADQAGDIAAETEAIDEFFNTKVFVQSTFAPADEACSALQEIADAKEIDADLSCEAE